MDLPKLYRTCWVKLYWITDTCEGGEHVQRDGYHLIKARRAKLPNNNWFWQLDPWDAEQCHRDLYEIYGLEPIDQFEGWVYKNPYPYKEGDWFEAYSRPTIKQQKQWRDSAAKSKRDRIPF